MRRIIGIAGAPGAGKTTYAVELARREGGVHLPMDGFHLADVSLVRLGLLDRKGAPETFDAWGYAALLARLRAEPDEVVWAPAFERDLEQPVAGSIAIPADTELVVTEGNYLLLDRPEWRAVRAQLDEVWFVELGWPGWTTRTPRWWPPPEAAPTRSSTGARAGSRHRRGGSHHAGGLRTLAF